MYARKSLGALLRKLRQAAGLTQVKLASSLKKSVPYVSGVERGARTISPALLEQLARRLTPTDEAYRRIFLLRERLPPSVERHFLHNPASWPVRRTAA